MNKANPKMLLFLGVIGISLSAIFVKFANAPSIITALYRIMWTVIILIPISFKKAIPEIKTFKKKEVLIAILSGVLFAGHFTFWFESLKHTTIASSTVLVDTDVIFAAIGFCLIMHGTIPSKGIFAIIIAIIGCAVTALAGNIGEGSSLYGNALALIAAVFMAGYTLSGKFMRSSNISTTAFTFISYPVCFITLLIVVIASGTPLFGYGARELLIGLALAIFCNLLGHSVVSWSLKYLTPGFVSAVKLCEPVFATILGVILFKEIPNIMQIIGALIIIAAVYLYSTVENSNS